MVVDGLSEFFSAALVVSMAVAILMTVIAVFLLRDIGVLERRLDIAPPDEQSGVRAVFNESGSTSQANPMSALEAKTQFLATVSHEMRTPMNGVLGMADLLAGTRVDAEQRTYIDAIRNSGEAMLALIDEILDFSKISAGKLDLVTEPFEIAPLCEGVAELLAPRAHAKGLEIAVYLAPDVPVSITSDPARFRQILINLTGNAIKFTETGGVAIRVEMLSHDRLAVTVLDTGIGIAPDRLQPIFEDFEQADGSASRRFGGTGLGLSISRRIAEGLRGSISVASDPGHGSSFRLELPVAPVSGETQRNRDRLPDLTGKSFLVVSKSRFEASFILNYLANAGATTKCTNDLASARAAIVVQPNFDGVIIDCAIGDGETRATAEASAAAGIPIRFVMLSPYERRALGSPNAAGFNGYLIKPLRARSLYARLREEPAEEADAAQSTLPPGDLRMGLKIMLAEDNEINALLAMRLLQRYGCEASWITDGLSAVSAFKTALSNGEPFDAILLDIRMPGIDGMEAARRIRRHERQQKVAPTRLIALTANAFPADQKSCHEAGFDSFVAKPLNQARLIEALTMTMNRQPPARRLA